MGENRAVFGCPKCGGETGVTDSRGVSDPVRPIRRRRKCERCAHRFTTVEVLTMPDFKELLRTVRLASSAIEKSLKALGYPQQKIPRNRVIWTAEMEATLIDMRRQGMTYLDCSDRIGVSAPLVAKKCHSLGLNGKANKGTIAGRKVVMETSRGE